MSAIILDASALAAFLLEEPGAGKVDEQFKYPVLISSVNYTETLNVIKRRQARLSQNELLEVLEDLQLEVIPFDKHQAYIASHIHGMSREFGLSLGDCVCLALALDRNLPVLTAERAWSKLAFKVHIEIRQIR